MFYYINLTGNLLFSIATLRGPHFFYYGNILYRNDNDGIEIADPTGRNIVRDFVPRCLLDWRKKIELIVVKISYVSFFVPRFGPRRCSIKSVSPAHGSINGREGTKEPRPEKFIKKSTRK